MAPRSGLRYGEGMRERASDRSDSFIRMHEDAPGSENERKLSEWFKKCDSAGAIPESRAGADIAYAMGHSKGLEEGQEAHLDAMRTLVMRILETRDAEPDDSTLDHLERATLRELDEWVFKLATENA